MRDLAGEHSDPNQFYLLAVLPSGSMSLIPSLITPQFSVPGQAFIQHAYKFPPLCNRVNTSAVLALLGCISSFRLAVV
jgi:hypothetical protein